MNSYNFDFNDSFNDSPSISSYPNSTIDLGSDHFPGFLESFSASEYCAFGDFTPTIGPDAEHGLFAHIKTFWRALFSHLNSSTRSQPLLQNDISRGYTVCIEKKSAFKSCMDKVTKKRSRFKTAQFCGPCEPLLETIDDAGEYSDQQSELEIDLHQIHLNESSFLDGPLHLSPFHSCPLHSSPLQSPFHTTTFEKSLDFSQSHSPHPPYSLVLEHLYNDETIYAGMENVEQSTDTLIDISNCVQPKSTHDFLSFNVTNMMTTAKCSGTLVNK